MYSPYEVTGLILAGLGLFFIGIRLIGVNLRMMTGRGFRVFLQKLTSRSWRGGLIGVLAGAITQSTSAVTFIMAGMVQAGLVSTRRAMPLVLWSNPGNCILVFLAVINFHVMILYLLGLVGFLYYMDLDKSRSYKPLIGGLLGAGLLFLGLDFIKDGASPLGSYDWVVDMMAYTQEAYIWGLLAAAVIAFLVQSAATVTAIAIALASIDVLTLESTLMIVYGSNLGPAVSTWLLAAKLKGAPKRLAVYQVIFKVTGLLVFVTLFYVEVYTKTGLVMALLEKITPVLEYQLAFAYLGFQIVGAIIISFVTAPLNRWLSRRYPESLEDALSKPKYMSDDALKEPEVAIALLEREQLRVIRRFSTYFDGIRGDSERGENPRILHAGTAVLCREIEAYFHELLKSNLSQVLVEKTLNLQNRMEVLLNLEDALYEMVSSLRDVEVSEKLEKFRSDIVEGSHVLLCKALDVMRERCAEDRIILRQLTEDRGDLMMKIHKDIRQAHPDLNLQEQQIFDTLSSRFERVVWMLRYLNKIVEEAATSGVK